MQPGSIVAEIERLNWSLAAITDIMRVLVRAKTEHEVFVAACEAAVRQDYYELAWIGLPRQDAKRSVLIAASAGAARKHLEDIEVSWGDVPHGRGPTGTALRSGHLQRCNDNAVDPGLEPWREWMRRLGLKSSLALPIRLPNGSVTASMTVYSRHENAFGDREAALFAQLGEDIGAGIEMLRTRAAYGKALAQAEEQGRRIELLNTALQTSLEGVAIADREGRIFSVNPAFTRITGYDPASLAGRHPMSLIADQPRQQSAAEIWARIERSGAWQGEIRCRKEGGTFPAMLGVNAARDGSGALTHHVITLLDLSRLKAAEDAARDERLFLDSIMESTPGIIYCNDAEGHILRWNRNFPTVSGYSDEEIAAMSPAEFFREEDRALVMRRVAEVFEKGESCVEVPLLTKDGRTLPYLFTGRRVEIRGEDYLVGMGIDLSDLKDGS